MLSWVRSLESWVRRHLVCVWHGEVQFKNPCCSCMLLNKKKSPKHLSEFSWSAQRWVNAQQGGWWRSVLLISPYHPLPSPLRPHPYSPPSSSVPASRMTPLAQLSRLEAFTETAPKRKARMWKNVCDFGWHKSSQRCPFVKDFQLLWNL